MKIGGFQRFSMIDYPDKVSAVVFTQGCNFSCPFCHNPELVDPNLFDEPLCEGKIFDFLGQRKGKLDGVVITGGEPTLQPDLLDFIRRIKEMGFLVKLDTNGTNPNLIKEALNLGLIDYIAMDIKAPLKHYPLLAGREVECSYITNTISLIKSSSIPYQFRTTIIPNLHNEDSIECIREWMERDELNHTFQEFADTKLLNPAFLEFTAI